MPLPFAIALASLTWSGRGHAQALTADSAVRAAVARHPTVRDMRAQVLQAEGALVAAGGPFEPTYRLSAQNNTDFAVTSATGAVTSERISRQGYAISASRLFSSGIVLSPTVAVTRSEFAAHPAAAASQGTVALAAVVPMLKDRGGAVSGLLRRATDRGLASAEAQLTQVVAQASADALGAYWNVVAAQARLEVYRDNEARAARIVSDTRALVEGDERTRADLHQVEANLAAKRVARVNAEQAVVEATQQLAIATGAAPTEAIGWGPPAEPFPDTLALDRLSSMPQLVAAALAARGDVRGARLTEQSGQLQLAGFRQDERPRLDAIVSVGYTGLATVDGVRGFLGPLSQNVPGPNLAVQFRYELPASNQGARGRAAQADGLARQQRVAREELERRVVSSVVVAATAVRTAHVALVGADTTVLLADRAVGSEMRKFRLGVSTVFDVILSQDALTNAQLTRITARRTYVGAVVSLRLVTGSLLERHGDQVALTPALWRALP